MNSPLPVIHAQVNQAALRRAVEIEYLAERYHRAFEEEAATLSGLLARQADVRLNRAFEALRLTLRDHTALQEQRLFRSYETLEAVTPGMHQAWIADSEGLSASVSSFRAAALASAPGALRARVMHFAFEVERHLMDELEVLGRWAAAR
jgi:hypothetical protein